MKIRKKSTENKPLHALICDDDEALDLARFLKNFDRIKSDTCDSVAGARGLIEKQRYDLAFCDTIIIGRDGVRFPDGFSVARAYSEKCPQGVVIGMSGDSGWKEEWEKMGYCFYRKPLIYGNIVEILNTHFGGRGIPQ